jgi:hypothetical protein
MQLAATRIQADPFPGVRIAQLRAAPDAPWVDVTIGTDSHSFYTYQSALEGVRELAAAHPGVAYAVTATSLPGSFFTAYELNGAARGWVEAREVRPVGVQFAPRLVSVVLGDGETVLYPVERV